jgi:hypothetical protein
MGTVTTGTGIVSPLTVGKSTSSALNVGTLSTQTNLTGSWSIDLKGSEVRHLDLEMFQESDMIFGSGKMVAGSESIPVGAAGSGEGDRLTVFITFNDNSEAIRLMLASSGISLAGVYESISPAGIGISGTVTGSMELLARQNPIKTLGKGMNPGATSGAWVGSGSQILNADSNAGHLKEKRSVYKSSTGESTTSSDETQITTSV